MTRDDPTSAPAADVLSCEQESIHLLGHVQPFGFLIAVAMDWRILHVSANIGAFLGCDPDDVVGVQLSSILPQSALHSIRGRLQMLSADEGTERLFGCDLLGKTRPFDVAVHVCGQTIIIEAEPSAEDTTINPGALVKSMTGRVQRTASLAALEKEAVRQLRGITGFDRVMLYRFAEDGSGAVIAESAKGGLSPYLGLHYPATDIPAQARSLYVRNQIRIVSDIDAAPVPILPPQDPAGEPIDLSLSLLRSVSPIHIEYLRNMGVAASFSISIVINDRLWGLFAFHHHTPRHLPMEMRAALELFGQIVSLMIDARIHDEQRQVEEAARQLHDRFLSKIVAATKTIASIGDFSAELREIIACDGLVVWVNGEAQCYGRVPPADALPALVGFLNGLRPGSVYAANRLGLMHPPALGYSELAAGILAIPLSRSPGDYLIYCRGEAVETVRWAGDPRGKPIVEGPDGPRLSPRKSFQEWQETVRGASLAWNPPELKAAEALRASILEILLRYNEETERQRTLASQRQELLIAELNHRVRNILGLMRALVAQSRPSARSIDDFAAIIGGRIQALARAHDQITSDDFAVTSLRDIIQTEVSAYIGTKASRVHLDGPDVTVEAQAFSTLALVFHEMVTNSAKYGALSDSLGSIGVVWRIDEEGRCRIGWRETGGPEVSPPSRRGFGSTIIERAIPHDLQGEAELRYPPAGLEADFVLPSAVFRQAPDASAASARMPGEQAGPIVASRPALSDLTGLIVEDNMIISLDAEQLMLDSGIAKVFIAASVSEARKIILNEAVDVALLDVNLGVETSFPLVADLNERGVPFVFVTGYGEQIELPPDAAGARTVKKPFAADQLLAALSEAAGRRPVTTV